MIWPFEVVVSSSGKRHIKYGYDVQQDCVEVLKVVEVCMAALEVIELVGVGSRFAFESEFRIVFRARSQPIATV